METARGSDPVSKPNLLLRFRRSTGARKFGRRIEKGFKRVLFVVMDRLLPDKNYALSELREIRKVLMIRPNFRIGNTLINARLIPSVRERFPDARIDFLGADPTLALLENMGLGNTVGLSRHHIYRWGALLRMLHRLRKERYDAVIDCGRGSLTSAILASLIRPRYRVGEDCGGARRLLNVRLSIGRKPHVYDNLAAFARALQGEGEPSAIPYYRVGEREQWDAVAWLCDHGLGHDGKAEPFVAVFVGGHLEKRCPDRMWPDLLRKMDSEGVRVLLFSGPEELALIEEIRGLELRNVAIAPLQKLRPTAALCAQARLVVSPDTGCLHLAAALELPVISILQIERSQTYAPKGDRDRVLLRPSVDEVVHALTTHPDWPRR